MAFSLCPLVYARGIRLLNLEMMAFFDHRFHDKIVKHYIFGPLNYILN